MPTASTAQILGNNESIEPYTQNLYVRRVLSGEFVTINRLMLLDLIENADKYSPPGRPIRLELHTTGSGGRIAVIDQGIGIPEAEQESVFERFKRGSNAAEKTGSGLGLSVVKLLVEGMGGTIELRSRLNEGSCFTVTLPR